MDWDLLRKQKHILLDIAEGAVVTNEHYEAIEGILNLIDFIQDQVVDSGQQLPEDVFWLEDEQKESPQESPACS